MKNNNAIAYIRTTNQTQKGIDSSRIKQRRAIEEYAKENNITIKGWFVDEVKSKDTNNNPSLDSLLYSLSDNQEDIAYILVQEFNRVKRRFNSCTFGLDIKLSVEGIKWISVNENTELSPIMLTGQIDSQRHAKQRELAKEGISLRLKQGYSMNRPPLGYSRGEVSGLFQINKTGESLARSFKDTLEGRISVLELRRAISKLSNMDESKTQIVSLTKLRRLASNPYYSGCLKWGDKKYKGLHTPLIAEEEQESLIGMLAS